VETCTHLHRTVQSIREAKARPGVVLNPATPLETLDWIVEQVDLVMLMSVNPGFGGQAFIPSTLAKLRRLKQTIQQRAPQVLIEVDGGVKEDNIADIAAAGADVLVAGSAIFGSTDYRATLSRMRQRVGGNAPPERR
jgi:ribulose-phosphate 3-epimerase